MCVDDVPIRAKNVDGLLRRPEEGLGRLVDRESVAAGQKKGFVRTRLREVGHYFGQGNTIRRGTCSGIGGATTPGDYS